jgi:hypothetical protein
VDLSTYLSDAGLVVDQRKQIRPSSFIAGRLQQQLLLPLDLDRAGSRAGTVAVRSFVAGFVHGRAPTKRHGTARRVAGLDQRSGYGSNELPSMTLICCYWLAAQRPRLGTRRGQLGRRVPFHSTLRRPAHTHHRLPVPDPPAGVSHAQLAS